MSAASNAGRPPTCSLRSLEELSLTQKYLALPPLRDFKVTGLTAIANSDVVGRASSALSARGKGYPSGGSLSWVRYRSPQSQDRTPASRCSRNSSLATSYRGSAFVQRS